MKNKVVITVCASMLILVGCGSGNGPAGDPPAQGTAKLDGLSTEEKIQKVQSDPQIPEQYKETYINSLKAKDGQGAPK